MSPSEHRKSDATCNFLTHRLAGVALRMCLGLHGLGGQGGLELGEISPFGHSEVPPVDFGKSRSATCKGKPTLEREERRDGENLTQRRCGRK